MWVRMIYLCSLRFLVQQRQPRQIFQEGVGGIENLGQEVEAFPLIVVQNLDRKTAWVKRTSDDLEAQVTLCLLQEWERICSGFLETTMVEFKALE